MKASEWTAKFLLTEVIIYIGVVGALVFGLALAFHPTLLGLVLASSSVGLIALGCIIQARLPKAKDVPPDFQPQDDAERSSWLADAGRIMVVPITILYLPLSLHRTNKRMLSLGAAVAAVTVAAVLFVLKIIGKKADWHDPWFVLHVIGLCSAGPLMLYFAIIGLFFPKSAIAKDRALQDFLARSGLRSLLGLRLVGAFLLAAVVLFIRMIITTS